MNVWMISLVVCLILPFDPNATNPCADCAHLCPLLTQTMNHPYMFPDEAPWTEDYYELRNIRMVRYIQQNTNAERYELENELDGRNHWFL